MSKRLRHLLEYAGAAAGMALVGALPLARSERLAQRLGDWCFRLAASRRRIVCENIRRTGIARDPAQVEEIARASFRHMALVLVEALRASHDLTDLTWRDLVELDFPPSTMDMLGRQKQGVILVSGHIGNWEIGAMALSRLKPVLAISRPMNNPMVERLIQRIQRTPGRHRFTTAPKHDTNPFRLVSALRRGDMLAILADQHARTDGMMVDFFGHPASTHLGCALLHRLTGAPLWFAYCLRVGPMRFRFHALEPRTFPKTGDRDHDLRVILEWVNGCLEQAIREHPEQYLWAHRRWRTQPADAPGPASARPAGAEAPKEVGP